jgi:transposase-like protein
MTGVYQAYKDLDPATEAALRASIERFGVLQAITVDQYGNVLDGHQRVRLAGELGVSYKTDTKVVADEDEAWEIARTLNEDRRPLPREQRLPVVKALREDGHSLRAIAGAVGVSQEQARQDLSTVKDLTVPDRITGLDGKSRPARVEKRPAAERTADIKRLADEGHTAAQIADHLSLSESRVRRLACGYGITLADAVLGKRRRIDDARILDRTVAILEGLGIGLRSLSDDLAITSDQAGAWAQPLDGCIKQLQALLKRLKALETTK